MINQLPIHSKGATMGHRHTEISISLATVTVSYVGMHVLKVAEYETLCLLFRLQACIERIHNGNRNKNMI